MAIRGIRSYEPSFAVSTDSPTKMFQAVTRLLLGGGIATGPYGRLRVETRMQILTPWLNAFFPETVSVSFAHLLLVRFFRPASFSRCSGWPRGRRSGRPERRWLTLAGRSLILPTPGLRLRFSQR